MDEEVSTSTTEGWRPAVWLIGVMLLVHGVNGAISYNPFGIWQSAWFFPRAMDYALVNIASIAVHFVISVGLIAAGVGLWRRKPWARRTAVGLLECLIIVTILIAFVIPVLSRQGWHNVTVAQTSYWREMLRSLQPFTLITNLIMLLMLLMPVARQVPGEEPPPGMFTGVAEWIRCRLPAGTPPLWLFIGLLFLCWGAGPWLNQLLSLSVFLSISWAQVIQYLPNFAGLLPALAYLIAGVLLLLSWQWSRQAAMAAIILDIVYRVYITIFTLVLSLQHLTMIGKREAIGFILLSPINLTLAFAIPIAILLLFRKAPPSAKGVGEVVPEG